jgi:hypothetical protein
VSGNQILALSGVPKSKVCHILVNSTGGADITVALPETGDYISRSGSSMTVPAGGSAEINVLYMGGKYILKTVEGV